MVTHLSFKSPSECISQPWPSRRVAADFFLADGQRSLFLLAIGESTCPSARRWSSKRTRELLAQCKISSMPSRRVPRSTTSAMAAKGVITNEDEQTGDDVHCCSSLGALCLFRSVLGAAWCLKSSDGFSFWRSLRFEVSFGAHCAFFAKGRLAKKKKII